MSYILNRFNGQLISVLPDGTISTVLDISLIGKNYAGYGEKQNENFIFLLENFSNETAPTKPLSGQLWYNSTAGVLKINVYDGTVWQPVAINHITTTSDQTAPVNSVVGNLWYDQLTNQFKVFNGTDYTLIGPQSIYGYAKTQIQGIKIQDTLNNYHPAQFAYINGIINFIISSDSVFTPRNAIDGFTTISPGINISSTGKFVGSATNSDQLGGHLPSFYAPLSNPNFPTVVKIVDAGVHIGSGFQLFNNLSGISTVKNAISDTVQIQTTVGATTHTPIQFKVNNILPGVNASTDIGSSLLTFKNIYAGYVYSTAQRADSINLNGTYITATTASASNSIVARDMNADITARKFIGKANDSIHADLATEANRAAIASLADVANRITWENVILKPNNFVFEDINQYAWRINISGNTSGTHTGPSIGNASTANKVNHVLKTGNYLIGIDFDGSATVTWDVDVGTAGQATGNKIVARDSAGDIWYSIGHGTSLSAQYADLAEKFLSDQEYEIGTVIMVGGEKEVTAARPGVKVIGVVSKNPAVKMNEGLVGGIYIALKGRVPVKVIGPVEKGDLLVSSENGYAKSENHSNNIFVFAISLENLHSASGIVEAVIL